MEFFHTHVSDESKKLVQQVLDSGFLNSGPMVSRFEKELEQFGLPNVVATNSCTSALHLALELCDVKGKTVLCPSQSFIASGLAILMAGAKVKFVDIDPYTGNIDIEKIRETIDENTAAIIVVDWGGIPVDIERVREFTQDEIPIIHDNAHSLGAEINGVKVGNLADYSCFSFQAIKLCPCGDGGALCIKNRYQRDEAVSRRWFGINKETMQRSFDGSRITSVNKLGWKYNMNDIDAAVGLGNLHTLEERLKTRSIIAQYYTYNIEWSEQLNAQCPFEWMKPAWWLYTIIVDNKVSFVKHMERHSIPVSSVDRGIHHNPVFGWSGELPGQNRFDDTQVSLPIHEALTMDDVRRVVDACNSWKG